MAMSDGQKRWNAAKIKSARQTPVAPAPAVPTSPAERKKFVPGPNMEKMPTLVSDAEMRQRHPKMPRSGGMISVGKPSVPPPVRNAPPANLGRSAGDGSIASIAAKKLMMRKGP